MLGPVSLLNATAVMPDLLGHDGLLCLMPSAYYDNMSREGVRLWCHQHARYGLPTIELIDWLKQEIGSRLAIEIGAGSGDLCSRLNIKGTDNYCQTFPDVLTAYTIMGQPVIKYPDFVERLSSDEAIKAYQPDVVVASWVTEWIDPTKPLPRTGGNIYGVHEDKIVDAGITYILIGNKSVHGEKKIMKQHHVEISAPYLRSRSAHPELDRIWIWNR
jgi:hypothetical protein